MVVLGTAPSASTLVTHERMAAYIASKGVNELYADSLEALLREEPANPAEFLADHFASLTDTVGTVTLAKEAPLNILLQEDLTIRGGAQLWIMNCGSRLQEAGHSVTFLLPSESLIIEDCKKIEGATVSTYDAAAIAACPADFKDQFTEHLKLANVCVTLVRQQRGDFQAAAHTCMCVHAYTKHVVRPAYTMCVYMLLPLASRATRTHAPFMPECIKAVTTCSRGCNHM